MSRTALDKFPMGSVEKDYLLKLIKHFSWLYFTKILGSCLMGNHFHLLVKMLPGTGFSNADIENRLKLFYGEDYNKNKKTPKPVKGISEMYSLKQLSELL
jgi:hypothetical protein